MFMILVAILKFHLLAWLDIATASQLKPNLDKIYTA